MPSVCYNTALRTDARHPLPPAARVDAPVPNAEMHRPSRVPVPTGDPQPDAEWVVRTSFTDALDRYRHWIFFLLILPFLVTFNGQWRMGLDSALYRGVAESLCEGRGYTFAGLPQNHVYPGLPALLAGVDRVTGSRLVVPLILMNGAALLTLALVYRLMLFRTPRWVAVVVTVGVALNAQFVQQSQEIMTDMPFLLGMVASLYGWELLQRATSRLGIARALAVLLMGLALAAALRPTFWVLAAAWVAVCAWRIIARRDRRAALALASLFVVWALLASVDPRFTGLNVFKGRYESEALTRLNNLGDALSHNVWDVLNGKFNEGFFSQSISYVGPLLTLVLLAGAVMVTRRQPLWGLPIFGILVVTFVMSDAPRYYMMVLPFVWLGYALIACKIARRLDPRWATITLFCVFSLANFLNIAGLVKLVAVQRRSDFLAHYKDGDYVPLVALANVIKERVKPGERVIGPYSSLLAYLSGRNVAGERELFDTRSVTQHPKLLSDYSPNFLIGPEQHYKKKDELIQRLLDRGVIGPGEVIVETPDFWLARAVVIVPPGDWRLLPDKGERARIAATRPSEREQTRRRRAAREAAATREAARVASATQPSEKQLAKQRRERRAAQAAREAAATEAVRIAATQPVVETPTTAQARRAVAERKAVAERQDAAERKAAKDRKDAANKAKKTKNGPTTGPAAHLFPLPQAREDRP